MFRTGPWEGAARDVGLGKVPVGLGVGRGSRLSTLFCYGRVSVGQDKRARLRCFDGQ